VYSFRAAVAQAFPADGADGCAKAGVATSNVLAARKMVLTAIMHHAAIFCTPGWRTHAVGPSVWIGERELAVQRVGG
jgi:hypothetical protein